MKKIIFAVLILISIVHFAIAIKITRMPDYQEFYDTVEYQDLVKTYLSTGKYQGTEFPLIDMARPPGYPAFLIAGAVLFQWHWEYVIYLQVVLFCVTAWLIYLIAKKLGNEKAGLLGAFLYLINPNATLWSMALLTEMLATILLVAALWFLYLFMISRKVLWIALSGFTLCMSAFVRPIILPLIVIWAILLIPLIPIDKDHLKSKWREIAIFITCSGLLIFSWCLRNWFVHQTFTFSTVGNSTFENWMVAKAVAKVENISRNDATALIASQPDPFGYSINFIGMHPVVFIKEQLYGILRTVLGSDYNTWSLLWTSYDIQTTGILSELFGGAGIKGMWESLTARNVSNWIWVGIYSLIFDFILYCMALIGTFKALNKRTLFPVKQIVILLLITILVLIILPAASGDSRFRAPADPLLSILASLCLLPIPKKSNERI
jgi:4-amino-4-deoxy-L-arabinose transferase-like glycosyltransferase